MPGNYPSPRPTAPRERGKWRKNEKNHKMAMSHGHHQSGNIKSHALRIALKGTKHLFLFPLWSTQTHGQQKASLPSPQDYYPSEKRPLSPEYWGIKDFQRSQMPLDEPAKKEEVLHETREGFQHTEERERLTGVLQTVLVSNPPNRDNQQDVLNCDFIYDILIFTFDKPLRRRMLVDFETEANFMDHDVSQRMNVRMDPYDGPPTQLTTRGELRPVGKVQATWTIFGHEKPYCAEFYVVRGTSFDIILGTTSCRDIGLYRMDPMVARRLGNPEQT
ncbi:hypothetical protein CBS115989_9562 [Aspergillus niger]|nr:hypothetical protein ANI_1_1164104 [Aspergillus niger CBS 513.88]KAI2813327.1 hypothetical protein CBS115989_9562 [Aspergillus niger]KAI2839998.1 hypothetical protein CBS11232_9206 [Aspergillus niger]KAI2871255.1 hypothetical protein CBS115988_8736 [Aspergillus niger]KAI3002215.1 hypothetical protein CBS147346_6049 [Aspergillus niger]|eukprot:XP_001396047.2 hypothetical protein ANI_1_1164104 [Aspergillus niger CBS 513.88]